MRKNTRKMTEILPYRAQETVDIGKNELEMVTPSGTLQGYQIAFIKGVILPETGKRKRK